MYDYDDNIGPEHPGIGNVINSLLLLMIKDEKDELSIQIVNGTSQILLDFEEMRSPPPEFIYALVERVKIMAEIDNETYLSDPFNNELHSGQFKLETDLGVIHLKAEVLQSDEGEGILLKRLG